MIGGLNQTHEYGSDADELRKRLLWARRAWRALIWGGCFESGGSFLR